jgi:hypothetical protein
MPDYELRIRRLILQEAKVLVFDAKSEEEARTRFEHAYFPLEGVWADCDTNGWPEVIDAFEVVDSVAVDLGS